MKTIFLTLALAAASFAALAQSQPVTVARPSMAAPADAFTATMAATIAEQNAAKAPAAAQAVLAKLERIAAAAPTAWEPRYYQARGYLQLGFASEGADDEQRDKLFDQAQAALDQAKKLPGADQAELLVMQAYIYQGRIMVAPMTRGMVYSGRVAEALSQAKTLAPSNPRVYLLLGNDSFYRPSMFGGGAEKAKPLYEKAKSLFASFKPATVLSPVWGEKMTDAMLARVNGTAATK
ncbi:hypothetical protein [Hymenobacter terrenus]|uniref:hypothetical protein n=1 Tax=Hymenobacter terrenus TaxID=1629124 RepID=UPI000619E763|nr:hypothetical protein [Hymenobacter terrenus]